MFLVKHLNMKIYWCTSFEHSSINAKGKNVYKKYDIQLSERTVLNNKRNI
jgi:hypothetical protein